MANNYSFSVMPSVSISRSRFERKNQHKTSFNLGDIVPIYVDEVLPGDTRSMDMAALVRMSTPIAPIMDNIYLDFFAFFVPNRIVWDHWKEFMGENNESAGIPSMQYSIPSFVFNPLNNQFEVGSYGDYMGLPVNVNFENYNDKISVLPFRGLAKIYNRWFRNQNLIAPLAVCTSDDPYDLVDASLDFSCTKAGVLKASKLPDYFTSSLPYAQKGQAVSIPLGTTADIRVLNSNPGTALGNAQTLVLQNTPGMAAGASADVVVSSANTPTFTGSLIADLSNATAATINQLRYAFQLQKLLEKDALYGTRYWEILAAHFGVTSPDASLQDPEYLGGKRMNINIDQVLSTAGYSPDTDTTVGQPGANSVSGFKGSLFTKSFTEHGYLFILAVARHDQTYGQGINRMWTRKSRYDFYFPVFANLGAQDVKLKEIYAQGTAADDNIFGYQESWAEYRYKPSIVSNVLRANVPNSLGFWSLANNFGAAPTLSQSFIEQDRNALSRALVTGSTGPDFIADFFFRDVAVRPMPVYSIPGLIDHH